MPEPLLAIDRRIAAAVERALEEFQRSVADHLMKQRDETLDRLEALRSDLPSRYLADEDMAPFARDAGKRGRREGLGALLEAAVRLDRATTQVDLLGALLEEAGRFCCRSALLLTVPDRLRGWAAWGFDAGFQSLENLTLDYGEEGPWADLAAGRGAVSLSGGACAVLCEALRASLPAEGVLIPLVLRNQVAAALYADRMADEDLLEVEPLQILVWAASQAVELLSLRDRSQTPTLYRASEVPAHLAGLPLWQPRMGPPAVEPTVTQDAELVEVAAEETLEPAEAEPEEEPLEGALAVEPPPATPEWEVAAEEVTVEEPPSLAEREVAAEEVAASQLEEAWEEMPSPAAEAVPEGPEFTPDWHVEPTAEDEDWTQEESPEATAPLQPAVPDLRAEPSDLEVGAAADEFAGEEAEEPVVAAAPAEPIGDDSWEEATGEVWEIEEEEPLLEAPPEPERPEETVAVSREILERLAQPTPSAEIGEYEEPLDTGETEAASEAEAWTPPDAEAWAPPDAEAWETTDVAGEAVELEEEAPEPQEPPPWTPEGEDVSEDETVLIQRPAFAEPSVPAPPTPVDVTPAPPAPPPPPSTAVPPPPPRISGREVAPPPDLEGPGWAFTGGRQTVGDDEAEHEEARRLARLLVSEIKLYNEDQVEEGRRNRDIYERLKDDIDRSRQMYEERVDARVREHDYFYDALVRVLAGGDPKALGI